MFEYHGWATIRESTKEDDETKLLEIVNTIKNYTSNLEWDSGVIDLRAVNGDFHFWLAGLDNHKPALNYDPVEVFRFIANVSPGSYGVLYFRDSDDPEKNDVFKVLILKRGLIIEEEDSYLSPVIPEIEDDLEE